MDKVETWLDFLMLCRSRSDLQKLQSKSRWRRVSHTLQPAVANPACRSWVESAQALLDGTAFARDCELLLHGSGLVWRLGLFWMTEDDRSKWQIEVSEVMCLNLFLFVLFIFFQSFFQTKCLMFDARSLFWAQLPRLTREAFRSFQDVFPSLPGWDVLPWHCCCHWVTISAFTHISYQVPSWLQLCNCFRCLGCSAILQLHSCRMQIFLESIGKKGTGQFLKLHLMTCTDFWKKQDEKTKWKSEVKLTSSFFPFHTICFFRIQVLPFFSIVWKQISWSLTSSISASPRSGDYVKESHGQRIGQAGSFMWHMFFHPRIDWILADLSLATPRCHDAWRRPQVELPKDHPYLSLLADEKHEKYEKRLRKAKIQGLLTEYPFARYES